MGIFDFLKRRNTKESSCGENPYEHLLWSIHGLCDQFKKNNKLGIIGNEIVIRKRTDHYDVDCNLLMPDKRVMNMGYTLDLSARKFLPHSIDSKLEMCGEAIIEQTSW